MRFEHFNVSDGLPERTIRVMLQDHLGFIWIGTSTGLVKYDGYDFHTFRKESGNPNSLSYNFISSIFEDNNGDLWIGTGHSLLNNGFGGLNKYERSTGKFYRYLHNPENPNSISSNAIHSITQDKDENLWIGTQNGLNKYDINLDKFSLISKSYKSINNKIIANQNVIASILKVKNNEYISKSYEIKEEGKYLIIAMGEYSFVENFSVDIGWLSDSNDQNIWNMKFDKSLFAGGTNKNRVYIDTLTLATGKYKINYKSDDSHSYKNWNSIAPYEQDLWGIQILEYDENKQKNLTIIKQKQSLIHDNIENLFIDSSNNLWIGSRGGGLSKYNFNTSEYTHYYKNILGQDRYSLNVYSITEDCDSNLWVGTWNGLYKYIPGNNKFILYKHDPENPNSLPDNRIYSLSCDKNNTLWISTWNGFVKYSIDEDKFQRFYSDPSNPNSINGTAFMCSIQDKTGITWIGSYLEGLNKYDEYNNQFQHYTYSDKEFRNIRSFYEDEESLWIGTLFNGIFKTNKNKNTTTNYKHNPSKQNSISNNTIYDFLKDKNGDLWIATGVGLNKFHYKTESFTNYKFDWNDPKSISHDHVTTLCEDSEGTLWVGTWGGGINKFDFENEKFIRYQHIPGDSSSLSHDEINIIFEDQNKNLWVGTNPGGLNKFDKKTQTFQEYYDSENNLFSITNLMEDSHGRFWIGTYVGGIHLFNRETGKSKAYNEQNGLPFNYISGLIEDNQGMLWIATERGLSRFNPKAEQFKNFNSTYDIHDEKLLQQSFLLSKTGKIYCGGRNGYTTFYPEKIVDNPYPPEIILSDFQIFNKSIGCGKDSLLCQHINIAKKIKLAYWQNDITLEYTALHFSRPELNQYAYKLENYDNGWQNVNTARTAKYTNMDQGTYTFHVKACNADGIWSDKKASIKIIITPPFWKTPVAYFAYILVFAVILYLIRLYDLHRQSLKNELKIKQIESNKLHELNNIKSHFFANISHEFRTPLTLILGPLDKLLSGKISDDLQRQYKVIQRNAKRLLQLINQLLDLSKIDAGSMKLAASRSDIIKFIKPLIFSFSSLGEQRNINFTFQSSIEKLEMYFDRDKMEMIINNLLSNAFKFTPEHGSISVIIKTDHKFLTISIEDTGIGIPEDKLDKIFNKFYQIETNEVRQGEGSGIGLSLTKELVELHHGQISVTSTPEQSTCFTVKLLLGKNHLTETEIIQYENIDEFEHKLLSEIDENEEIKNNTSVAENAPIVLIVEDNKDIRNYIRENLESIYQVHDAPDGKQGLDKAIEISPALIISDVMMPVMNGIEFCNNIKTDERVSHIPVILLTAKASIDNKIEGLEIGADDYISKPFNSKELLVRIKNLIDQRKKLKLLFREQIIVQPQDISVTSADELFLKRVMAIVEENISNSDFAVDDFIKDVGMSRAHFYRKLKAITDQRPGEFIRLMRLKRAAQFFQQKKGSVSEIAYEVGFNNLSYFAKSFRELFNCSPSEYLKKQS